MPIDWELFIIAIISQLAIRVCHEILRRKFSEKIVYVQPLNLGTVSLLLFSKFKNEYIFAFVKNVFFCSFLTVNYRRGADTERILGN